MRWTERPGTSAPRKKMSCELSVISRMISRSMTGASIRTGAAFADRSSGMLQVRREPPSTAERCRKPRRFNKCAIGDPPDCCADTIDGHERAQVTARAHAVRPASRRSMSALDRKRPSRQGIKRQMSTTSDDRGPAGGDRARDALQRLRRPRQLQAVPSGGNQTLGTLGVGPHRVDFASPLLGRNAAEADILESSDDRQLRAHFSRSRNLDDRSKAAVPHCSHVSGTSRALCSTCRTQRVRVTLRLLARRLQWSVERWPAAIETERPTLQRSLLSARASSLKRVLILTTTPEVSCSRSSGPRSLAPTSSRFRRPPKPAQTSRMR